MEEKRSKKKVAVISIIVGLILIAGIGLTIAYFSSRSTSDSKTITTGNLSIVYENENEFNLTNQIPLYEEDIKSDASQIAFSINNTGNVKGYASIKLTDIVITNNIKNANFMYMLYDSDTNKEVIRGNFNFVSTEVNVINDIELNPNDIKNYKIYVWISETDQNQSSMMNGNFSGKINITGNTKRTNIPNTPLLSEGLIPVVYDATSGNWEVADTSTEWYDYYNQKWANAVTTSSSTYRTATAGTEIPMSSINSMWVWIPRYKYKISSNIGSSSNVTNPPEIDVVFESGLGTTGSTLSSCPIDSTTCYYTHPAFRNGSSVYTTTAYDQGGWSKELSGIWVGKFETGTEGDTCSSRPSESNCKNVTPVIKPDIQSLRSQNVSTQFQTVLKFAGGTMNTSTGEVTFAGNSTYGLTSTTDTHMAKNTEWGAVAYLSQSKYGKYGNSNYTGNQKEIYINNSSSYYTGRSGGNVGGSTPINGTYTDQTSTTEYNSYGFYTYDDYLLSYGTNTKSSKVAGKGVGASTTGTIYGIYDMSGGALEYTMSNWNGYSGYSSSYNSGFNGAYYTPSGSSKTDGVSFPSQKYYDKYTKGTSSGTITKENAIKGDATYETMRWYSDYAFFVCANGPWAHRGGYYDDTSNAGVFASSSNGGDPNSHYSLRSVLIP